jgi:hypothetical protein
MIVTASSLSVVAGRPGRGNRAAEKEAAAYHPSVFPKHNVLHNLHLGVDHDASFMKTQRLRDQIWSTPLHGDPLEIARKKT